MIKYCNVSFVESLDTKEVIFSWLEDRNVLLKLESVLNGHPKIIFTDIGNCIGWCNFEFLREKDEVKIYYIKYLDVKENMMKGFIALLTETKDPTYFLMEVENYFNIEICTFNLTGEASILTSEHTEIIQEYIKELKE
ncbi:hypothetical protein D929_00109 [Enterococcus faecalis 02-MB-P-10]|uniref:hypothetical protein n=1 Tax=Enterococcus faecalis TaxID=1351 RepID=UPI00035408F4|nr:hypothetical protein [Enterococcus faecalis]EPH77379.1 hypothetical protein D929_00109 [Enterococcus faecalis 02-MB-P-10]